MPMKKFQHIRVIHTTMPMKKLQHIRDIPVHCFSRQPRELMKDAVYERYRRAKYRFRYCLYCLLVKYTFNLIQCSSSLTKIYKLCVWNEYLKNFVCKLKPIIIETYTESNESLKITRLRNPIVCSGLLLKQTQAYIYIRLIASGIDTIHNCPKCLKEKHFQKFRWPPNLQQMVQSPIGIKSRC
jgi:hypothetical protein